MRSKASVVSGKGKPGKKPEIPVLGMREIDDLNTKINGDKALLGEVTGTPEGSHETHFPAGQAVEFNKGAVMARIRRNKNALETMGPDAHRLTGAQRQGAEKEYFAIKKELSPFMLTMQMMDGFPSTKDAIKDANYRQGLKKALAPKSEHSEWYLVKAHRAKRLARILWPDDSEMGNLENWRETGEKTGRHFRT